MPSKRVAIVLSGVCATAYGLNLAPLQTSSPGLRPSLRSQRASVPALALAEEEEEFMTEEEYLAQEEAMASAPKISAEELAEADEDAQIKAQAQVVINNLKSDKGVEFAPWMQIDPEAVVRAKKRNQERKERAAAANAALAGLEMDPQAAETGAALGLRSKVLSEEEVELRWETDSEVNVKGFTIQRRAGGTPEFEEIASFDRFPQLKSKGPSGGSYSFIDDGLAPGSWVYRICDEDTSGKRAALCQQMVEIESQSEQVFTLILGGFLGLTAIAGVLYGISADPLQTTEILS